MLLLHRNLLLLACLMSLLDAALAFVAVGARTRPTTAVTVPSRRLVASKASAARLFTSSTLIPRRRKSSDLEIGIQTAQMLLNEKKRAQLRDDILQQYPFLPEPVIESVMDIVADGFMVLCPKELKNALTPGGMETMRPKIRESLLNAALEHDAVRHFPILHDKDKASLLGFVIDAGLDRLFEDCSWVLLPPEARLESLYDEVSSITRTEMTKLQVAWFYVKRHPLRYAALTTLSVFLLYAQLQHGGSWKQAGIATFHGASAVAKVVGATLVTLAKFVALRGYIFLKVLANIVLSTKPAYGPWKYLPTYC